MNSFRFIKDFLDLERVNYNKNSWHVFENTVSDKYSLRFNFKIKRFLNLLSLVAFFLAIASKTTQLYSLSLFFFFFASIFLFAKLINSLIIEYYLIREPIPSDLHFILPQPLEKASIFFMRRVATTLTPETVQQGVQTASRFYIKNSRLVHSGVSLLVATSGLALGIDEARALFVGETTFISRLGEINRTGCFSRHSETAMMAGSLSNDNVDVKDFTYPNSKELNPRLIKKRFLSTEDEINA